MSEKIRAFIAIELNKDTQNGLAKIQNELRACGADVKWVKPENIHLTLKFLGDIDSDLISKIKNILEDIAKKYQRFPAEVNELGAFPKLQSPRVIWAGIEKDKEKIIPIAEDLENKLSEIGIPKEERVFSAHVTIGRLRSPLNRLKLVELLKVKTRIPDLNFLIEKIALFQSTLTPQGPIYEAKIEVSLKEA